MTTTARLLVFFLRFLIHSVYVLVKLYSCVKSHVPLFLGLVMYGYEIETKENKIQNKDNIKLEQIHLSYIVFTQQRAFFNVFQNYEFSNNICPETFSVIYILWSGLSVAMPLALSPSFFFLPAYPGWGSGISYRAPECSLWWNAFVICTVNLISLVHSLVFCKK